MSAELLHAQVPAPRTSSVREQVFIGKPPFNDSDTAPRSSAFFQSEAKPQVVSEAKNNFRGKL
jgi:hypothetical protein